MATSRPVTAIEPLHFGRRSRALSEAQALPERAPQDDLRLFAATFAAGFLFVSILIG